MSAPQPAPQPTEPAAEPAAPSDPSDPSTPGAPSYALRTLAWSAPFQWMALGWQDFRRAPAIGLFYGACFTGMGWALMWLFEHNPAWVLALSAGFLLSGPFLCLGLYQASRRLEQGQSPGFIDSVMAWSQRTATLGIFGFVLLVMEMLWGRASLVVFAVSFDGMPDFKGSLLALLDPANIEFIVAYVAVGGVFAGLIYSISVISIPMLLDTPADAITAGLTSVRLVLGQPGVMLLWGALIAVLAALAMLPGFLGLLVVGPVIGHASWHAFRAAVDTGPEH